MKKNKKEKNLLYTRMLALGYDDVTDRVRDLQTGNLREPSKHPARLHSDTDATS